jgi:hypothetical protein
VFRKTPALFLVQSGHVHSLAHHLALDGQVVRLLQSFLLQPGGRVGSTGRRVTTAQSRV